VKRVARFRPQPDAAVLGHGDHFRCGLLAYRELDDLLLAALLAWVVA
jgi:hypothetical protein